MKRYEENNYDPQSLLPRHRGGFGRKTDFSPEELGFHMEFATAYQSRDRPTKIDCYTQMGEVNQKRKAGGDGAMRVASLRTFQRIIDVLGDYKNEVTRAGDPSRVTRKYSISRRGYVLAESCKLELGFALTRDFVLRLMHGGVWRFGTTVHIIKNAIEKTLWDKNWSRTGGGLLTAEHFAQGYRRLARNCPDETNVLNLKIKDWHLIQREFDGTGQLADLASVRGRRRTSK